MYVKAPLRSKIFDKSWYNCSQHQLQIICDNIIFWDGSITKAGSLQFASNVKDNITFVQFAFASCGYRTKIVEYDRRGQKHKAKEKEYVYKTIEYRLNIAKNNKVSYSNYAYRTKTTGVDRYASKDGYKYCFTVPTSYFIARRNGCISVLHNSGKSSSLTLATSILNKHHSYSIAQTALSGRAASRMSEITGLPGYTIHRLLGINFETGVPAFSEKIPLNKNIIILDETSMVDGYIFLKLLKAIKTGSKLVMLGDTHQLECIGLCNLLNDMIQSHVIPHLDLKKIHRQAAKSGIISTAAKISNGQQIIPSIIWQGAQTCGELQDLDIIGLEGNALSQETILDEYRKLIGKGINKDDIDVIVPMRKRGDICLNVLNQKIQDIVANKSLNYVTCRRKTKEDNEVDIYEGDRIIVTQNNYHDVMDENGLGVPIFNGNIGKVINISPSGKEMTVDLYQQGKVIIPSSVFSCIDLGYAITCHAKQGSETPYAIIGLDSSCYTLLSREWLYTALTRAKKHCILIGQNTMLFKAVKISSISKKQTWLTELLQKN